MPEIVNNRQVFSLIEVTVSIQKTLAERYKSSFWVKAEMNKLNHYSHSGHCYPELVEKQGGKVIAQTKCNLWKNDFDRINANFLNVLKEPLKDGINILFCASISFDPVHGFSLRILDIDPVFSLGELEREKRETLDRLKGEGILHSNKVLDFPLLPQRIAVISVETSKGYADFLKIMDQNPWGYKFFKFLFPSVLQGEKSVVSIVNQLRQIKKVKTHFDVVVIVRGGGGDVGLSSYNHFSLAREIALFPIPVLTGIGHSTNETVAEMVSFKNAITPTELADFLIQKFHDFSNPVKRGEEIIVERSRRILDDQKLIFRNTLRYFRSVTKAKLQRCHHEIGRQSESVLQHSKFLIRQHTEALNRNTVNVKKGLNYVMTVKKKDVEKIAIDVKDASLIYLSAKNSEVDRMEKNVGILDPVNLLKRGFSITLHNGKALKHSADVREGETITTVLQDGKIVSIVHTAAKNNDS